MSISISYELIALLAVLIACLWRRSLYFKNKLRWIETPPGWPLVGNALEFSDPTKSLNAMHKYALKYNGLCYIELLFRPLVLISDHKFLEWLLQSNTLIKKSQEYRSLNNWLEDGLLLLHGQKWRKARKILTPPFFSSILEQFVDVFERPTEILVKLLNEQVGKDSVDIYPFLNKFGLDMICETAMGVQMNVQEHSKSEYVEAVAGMGRIVVERIFNPLKIIDFLYYLSNDYRMEKKYVKLLHSVSNGVIEKKKEEIKNKTNDKTEEDHIGAKKKIAFLDLLLTYQDENGQPLSNKFIREQVDTFMFAGHDTTSSANSFALYELANHPDVQEKALKEIKEVLQGRDKITYRDLQNMKYLELVIKETLRLYPSVPFFFRQTTEETIYDGDKIIPKGVSLMVVTYAIHRDPKVYDEPDKFIPTRFLNMGSKHFSYIPFSAGPRNCIGQKFGIINMKSTLAKILLNFELLPAIPEHKLILSAEAILRANNGVNIRLKKREKSF